MTQRHGNWMLTASGRQYWPADPRPEDVYLEDVAAQLAKLCRFTGACREFYSVAEHSVHVSRESERKALKVHTEMRARWIGLIGLHHDDPEAYINDMNRPTKRGPNMEGYRELERVNWGAAHVRFKLPEHLPPEVEEADHEMLFHEGAAIMPPMPPHISEAWGMGLPHPEVLRPEIIQCWDWRQARTEYLKRHEELTK